MKKTLAAVAILGAFAGSALADVTVYGKIDLGLAYTHQGDTDKVEMGSGNHSASRIGLKGSEKIGDMTVGFNYEFGMSADSGNLNTASARVSQLYVKGAYGELGFGRYGVLDSGTGPYDTVGVTAAGTGYFGDIMDQGLVLHTPATTRWNNAITYKAPTFAGLTLLAQVASGTEADTAEAWGKLEDGSWGIKTEEAKADRAGAEYSHDADMYYAVGAKYQAGDFGANLVYSTTEFKAGEEDMNIVAGVNYNFGVAKVWLAGNYYESGVKGHDHYGFAVSVAAPAFGGEFSATAGYGEDGYADKADKEVTMVGAAYKYPLSKQTYLYAAAGWDMSKQGATEVKTTEATFGMVHNF